MSVHRMQRVAPDKSGGAMCVHFGSSPKEAVITTAKQVDIYNYEDHRCLDSWSSRTALSAAAVQHPQSGRLYAVLSDGSQLKTWARSDTELLDKSTTPSQHFKVKSLHVCAAVAGAVAVHANATVSILGEDLSSPVRWVLGGGTGSRRPASRVVAVSLMDDDQSEGSPSATMLLFVESKGPAGACCHHLAVSASSIKLSRTISFERPSAKSSMLDAVFLKELGRVAVLWSCHTMQSIDIKNTSLEAKPVVKLTRHFRAEGSLLVGADGRSMPMLAAAGPSCILIAGLAPAAQNENSSKVSRAASNEGPTLTLWDANWGTLQGEQRLPDPPDVVPRPRKASDGVIMPVAAAGVLYSQTRGSALLLAHGVCWRWDLPARPRGLLQALGRLRAQAQRFLMEKEPWAGGGVISKLQAARNEAKFGDEMRAYREVRAKQDAEADAEALKLLNREDEWICGTYGEAGKKKREAFEQDKAEKEAKAAKETAKKVEITAKAAAASPTGVMLDQGILIAAVERCLRDGFWKELDWLLRSTQVSACAIPSLLPTLMEKKRVELLQRALVCVHDIPDAGLAELLKYILSIDGDDGTGAGSGKTKTPIEKSDESSDSSSSGSSDDDDDDDDDVDGSDDDENSDSGSESGSNSDIGDDDDQKEGNEDEEVWMEGAKPLSPQLHQMLCLLLSRPRCDAALQRELRGLTTAHVTTLLQLLLTLLEQSELQASQAEADTANGGKKSGGSPAKDTSSTPDGKQEALVQSRAPKLPQILDWVMLLVDAHFTRLLVIPSCHALLRRWMASVDTHERLAHALTPLKGVLTSIEKKQKETKKLKEERERKTQQAEAAAAEAKVEAQRKEKRRLKRQKKQQEKEEKRKAKGQDASSSSDDDAPNEPEDGDARNTEISKESKKKPAATISNLLGRAAATQPAYSIEIVEFL